MNNYNTVVGLDVHKETIVAAVLPPGSERFAITKSLPNQASHLEKFVRSLSARAPLEFVYEAGPCGYEVYRQLSAMGQSCVVIAPGLTPQRPGDRVKTDRRDAEKLASLQRAGQLTAVRVPTREEESARDLTRVREDALSDRLRARNRLSKFMLRQGRVWRETKAWSLSHRTWLKSQSFEFDALGQTFEGNMRALEEVEARLATLTQSVCDLAERDPYRTMVSYLKCLKGIDTLSALILIVEAQDFRRFGGARSFMCYTGLVSREYSSGESVRRGHITKAGNTHVRRILVESAWNYRHTATTGKALAERREGCPDQVVALARKAQARLSRKFKRLVGRGKSNQVAVVAVARELAGFVWAIARLVPTA